MDWLGSIIGFIAGCISSGLVSIIWNKLLVPKVEFASTVCKYNSMHQNDTYTYKIKFRNLGKRDMYDMSFYCILYMPDLNLKGTKPCANINVDYNFRPIFKKRGNNPEDTDGLVRICMNDRKMKEEFMRPIYPNDIRHKAERKLLTLEDLLGITKDTYLQFYVIASDGFSSSKKVFESSKYRLNDIRKGYYKLGEMYVI